MHNLLPEHINKKNYLILHIKTYTLPCLPHIFSSCRNWIWVIRCWACISNKVQATNICVFFTDSAVNFCRQHALFSPPCTFFRFSVFLWKTNEKHVFHFSPIWISRITVTSPITTVLYGPLFKKICHNNNWLTPLQVYNVCPKLIRLLCDAWWVNLFLAVRLNFRSVLLENH